MPETAPTVPTATVIAKPGPRTTEFWLTLLVVLISQAYAVGLVGAGTPLDKGLSFVAGALAAYGYAGARASVKGTVHAASAVIRAAAVGLLAIALLHAAPACGPNQPGPVIGTTVIDCTGQNASAVATLFADFKAKLTGGGSWALIEADAKSAGVAIGGCALALLVQDYLGNRGAPPRAEGNAARAALEDFRAKVAGGATFKTAAGNL